LDDGLVPLLPPPENTPLSRLKVGQIPQVTGKSRQSLINVNFFG